MNDRELIDFAAKAAGIEITWFNEFPYSTAGFHPAQNIFSADIWNPLTDDGDALRLAVKLKLDMLWAEHEKSVVICNELHAEEAVAEKVRFTDDPYAATRRAIVRAAAEIGKAK